MKSALPSKGERRKYRRQPGPSLHRDQDREVIMNSPTKRIAWITGGGTGIGLAGATSLAKEGWEGVISGRRSGGLSRGPDSIRGRGGAVDQIVLDVENVEHVNDTAAQILKK